jgi:transcription antitermination factor NusG
MSAETQPYLASSSKRWFALSVKPRHEKSCAAALRQKGFEEFLPLYRSERRWSDRLKEVELPLFAGYAFCRFEAQSRLPILTTPGVLRIVGSGKEPTPIPDTEIEALRSVVKAGLTAEPCPYLEAGAAVVVDGGPLRGVEGTLLEVKQQERLVLSIGLLQRSVAVEVDRRWVKPLLRRAAAGR